VEREMKVNFQRSGNNSFETGKDGVVRPDCISGLTDPGFDMNKKNLLLAIEDLSGLFFQYEIPDLFGRWFDLPSKKDHVEIQAGFSCVNAIGETLFERLYYN